MISVFEFTSEEKVSVSNALKSLATEGYKCLAWVSVSLLEMYFQKQQQELSFIVLGLVAFYDPPIGQHYDVFNSFTKRVSD